MVIGIPYSGFKNMFLNPFYKEGKNKRLTPYCF